MADSVGDVIAFCPKCNKSISDQNPYSWCVGCGEPLTPEIKAKIPLLVQREIEAKEKQRRAELSGSYNHQKIKDDWQQKSNEQVINAAERLSTFSTEEEGIIRAELRRRDMPEPGPTIREVQSVGIPTQGIDGKSSLGLQPNIAATISYALVWVFGNISYWLVIGQMLPGFASGAYSTASPRELSSIMPTLVISLIISGALTAGAGFIYFVMEKESRFVRVHAMQAILFSVLSFVSSIVFSIGTMTLGVGVGFISAAASIAFLVGWIWLMIKAYKGDMLKLPVISEQAENIVTK